MFSSIMVRSLGAVRSVDCTSNVERKAVADFNPWTKATVETPSLPPVVTGPINPFPKEDQFMIVVCEKLGRTKELLRGPWGEIEEWLEVLEGDYKLRPELDHPAFLMPGEMGIFEVPS